MSGKYATTFFWYSCCVSDILEIRKLSRTIRKIKFLFEKKTDSRKSFLRNFRSTKLILPTKIYPKPKIKCYRILNVLGVGKGVVCHRGDRGDTSLVLSSLLKTFSLIVIKNCMRTQQYSKVILHLLIQFFDWCNTVFMTWRCQERYWGVLVKDVPLERVLKNLVDDLLKLQMNEMKTQLIM